FMEEKVKLSNISLCLAVLISSKAFAFDSDLTNILGFPIGGTLAHELVGLDDNKYPTRIIKLDVLDKQGTSLFEEAQIQIIESTKLVYSLEAEKEFPNQEACVSEYKLLFDTLDSKYQHLKVVNTVSIAGKTFSTFEGYLSTNGERKLSLSCAQKDSNNPKHTLVLSARDVKLTDEAAKLWATY
ncbi:TPA: hypothetical protein ACN35K_004709, partial [Vibrio parahaemolyticus]